MLATGYDLDNVQRDYPAIYNHLQTMGEQIESGRIRVRGKGVFSRDDQGDNIGGILGLVLTIHDDLKKGKIVWTPI